MTLAANTIGNLLTRHLRYDLGEGSLQKYNANPFDATTNPGGGRGYLMSADGRVVFYIDLGSSTPKYAVSLSSGALTDTERSDRAAAADKFVAGTLNLPTSNAVSNTDKNSLFYKAFDADIIDLSKSLGAALVGSGPTAFPNMGMVLETFTEAALANATKADPNSGIRTVISAYDGPKYTRLFSEGSEAMSNEDEFIVLGNVPTQTPTTSVNGKGGFDYLITGLMTTATSGVMVDFSVTDQQTYIVGSVILKFMNVEGTELTDKDDTFNGSSLNNTVFAGKGKDTITDVSTSDRDWVRYDNAKSDSSNTTGIKLATTLVKNTQTNKDVVTMTVTDHGGSKDTLTNIEAVAGTYNKDEFKGGTISFNQIFAGLKGADAIDGGGGNLDRVWHLDDPSGVVVNLSSASVSTKSLATLVNSIKFAGASPGAAASIMMLKEAVESLDLPVATVKAGTALDGWGMVDTLTGIEGAFGSNFNDMLYGSKDPNGLTGGNGLDLLVGHAGDDVLIGGFGHDFFTGGQGRDWIVMDELNWGKLTAQGTNYSTELEEGEDPGRWVLDDVDRGDIVIYVSVSESLADDSKVNNKSDVLDGFVLGDDIIDLSGIDANTLRSGNQAFQSIDTQFNKKAGDLKVSQFSGLIDHLNKDESEASDGYKLSGIKIQGDVNGDGVADFEVKLVGVGTNVDFGDRDEVNALLLELEDSIFF